MRRAFTAIAATVVIAGIAATPAAANPRWEAGPPTGSVVDVAVKASGGGAPDANPDDYDLLVQAVTATGLAPSWTTSRSASPCSHPTTVRSRASWPTSPGAHPRASRPR